MYHITQHRHVHGLLSRRREVWQLHRCTLRIYRSLEPRHDRRRVEPGLLLSESDDDLLQAALRLRNEQLVCRFLGSCHCLHRSQREVLSLQGGFDQKVV